MEGNLGLKVAVLGGGSWATALVKILNDNKVRLTWWMRNEDDVQYIARYHHHPRYLTSAYIQLRHNNLTTDIFRALRGADVVILAVPAAFLSDALSELQAKDLQGKVIVSAIKGMIPHKNLLILDYLVQSFGIEAQNVCMIAGPCHAEEVAAEKLSYLTIAGMHNQFPSAVANLLRNRYIRVNISDDIVGAEYASVMKNIFAIAAGIAHGVGFGDNFHAVLIANALQEIDRFVQCVKPQMRDIKASAYLGDLLVTAYSQFSRNRTFGNMIGKGYSVKSAQLEMNMVAEGYYAVKCIYDINRTIGASLPITNAVYHILYDKTSPKLELHLLCEALS